MIRRAALTSFTAEPGRASRSRAYWRPASSRLHISRWGGIDSTLLALGRPSVHDLSPDDVIVPVDFARGMSK